MRYTTIHTIKYILGTLLLLTSCFFATSHANAYFTTGQKAEVLDAHSGLFLIEYAFGMAKHEVHMPALAYTGKEATSTAVSYAIIDKDGNEVTGKSVGIVFSETPLTKNGIYVIPKGTSKKMTLAVIFTPTTGTALSDYRLQVKHLPFSFDGTQQLQLNPSELQYYTTEYLSL
jgi:hypothetical protein